MKAVAARSFVRNRILPPLLAFVAFIAAWQALVWIGNYPAFVLPGPGAVAVRFVKAWLDGTMLPHATATLQAIFTGFVTGAGAGLVTGYVLAHSRLANRVLSPYLVAAQAVPILALAPLLTIWFGSGLLARAIVVALTIFFPVAVSAMVAFRSVDRRLIEMARSYRVTRRQRVILIELPAAMPGILGGMRIGVTLSVVGAIVAEWAGGDRGLGVLINIARGSLSDIPLMFATLLTIALIGIALYTAVLLVERHFSRPAA
jgi:NitT/TauT family transport system permease protein